MGLKAEVMGNTSITVGREQCLGFSPQIGLKPNRDAAFRAAACDLGSVKSAPPNVVTVQFNAFVSNGEKKKLHHAALRC